MLDIIRYSVLTAAILLLGITAAAFLGGLGQPFEVLSHFRIQWAVAALGVALVALVMRARLSLAVAGMGFLVNAGVVGADLLNTIPNAASPARGLTVVWANIEGRPSSLAAIAALAEAEGADVVGLTELPVDGMAAVAAALPGFACVTTPVGPLRAWTTVLASRAPCVGSGNAADFQRPSDAVFLDLAGVRVIALHPQAPWGANRTRQRDDLIQAAAALKAPSGETLLIGDFNASAYSEGLAPVGAAGFKRAACGAPWATTWRDPNPVTGLLIDHAFVTPGLATLTCRVGPWNTSDHAPLITRIGLP